MLARLRIRQKLAVLLVIPLVAVALVMTVFSVDRVAEARAYGATAEAALAARDVGGLIQTLQQERLLALGYLALPTLERSAVVSQGQTAVADTHSSARTAQAQRAIAKGVLTDHGAALAGADVVAIAWPRSEALQQLKDGDPVPTYVIGHTKTDHAGRFTIAADPAALPSAVRGDADQVDIELGWVTASIAESSRG